MTSATRLGINRATLWLSVIVGLSILLPALPKAATGTLAPQPYFTVFDSNGDPVSGACVWTYTAGTTTPVATYTDVNLSVANANPIVADSAGRFVAYLTQGVSYKFVFETACTAPAHGTTIKTSDNIASVPGIAGGVDVIGTAGEAISAGNAVYLSDGSGSKTQGSWYKADTANQYSSTMPLIGMAPSSISSLGTGSIRIAGQVTGLSSLTIGADYYLSTTGAITATAPAVRRWIGRADTTSTLVIDANPPGPIDNSFEDFRLTLTSGLAVTTADVTAATTLYASPYRGNRITLYNASGSPETCTSAEFSLAVPGTTSQLYDVWAYDSTFGTCTVTMEFLAWTNDTTRATAIAATTTGSYTKSGDLTRRYLGSFRTTTVSGQTEDSKAKRYVWNYYNRVRRNLTRLETTASWTYTTASFRQANAAAANQVDFVAGVAEAPVTVILSSAAQNTSAGVTLNIGIGLDVTNANSGNGGASATYVANINTGLTCIYHDIPSAGRHFLAWVEQSAATGTTTWNGTGFSATSGLSGWYEG